MQRQRTVAGLLLPLVLAAFPALGACSGDDEAATTVAPLRSDERGSSTDEADDDVYGIDLSGLDLPEADAYEDWVDWVDDERLLEVVLPAAWDDVDPSLGDSDGVAVPSIWASTDLEQLLDGYDVPGAKLAYRSDDLAVTGVDGWLTELSDLNSTDEACADVGEFDYDDGAYEGAAELWTDCGDSGAAFLVLAARPASDPAGTVTLEVQMLDTADVGAAVAALDSFRFLGTDADVPRTGGDFDDPVVDPPAPPPTTAAPTTAPPAPAPAPVDRTPDVLALLDGHLSACGMDWEDAEVRQVDDGQWEVWVYLLPPPDGGDPGAGLYLVEPDTGAVTGLNGTAAVLCP